MLLAQSDGDGDVDVFGSVSCLKHVCDVLLLSTHVSAGIAPPPISSSSDQNDGGGWNDERRRRSCTTNIKKTGDIGIARY